MPAFEVDHAFVSVHYMHWDSFIDPVIRAFEKTVWNSLCRRRFYYIRSSVKYNFIAQLYQFTNFLDSTNCTKNEVSGSEYLKISDTLF